MNYKIAIGSEIRDRLKLYLSYLQAGNSAGAYLQRKLADCNVSQLTDLDLLELLIRTKRPQIFAESEISGNGTDWNQTELSILGDISIITPVTVYDNGRHRHPEVHDLPFSATLIFTPGALLRNGWHLTPADWLEVTRDDKIDRPAYDRLYARRLLPGFLYANDAAKVRGKTALITIPGLGCGQFAGQFRGQLGAMLQDSLAAFLKTHSSKFSNIKVVYYDPYSECENRRMEIDRISLLVRPLTKGNNLKPQLCRPEIYAEIDDNFDDCELFSFVAWDHVSWPGNDFYGGSRVTDDGVKAAATNVMMVMTGIEGTYDRHTHKYIPPAKYTDWGDVVSKNQLQLEVKDNLIFFSTRSNG